MKNGANPSLMKETDNLYHHLSSDPKLKQALSIDKAKYLIFRALCHDLDKDTLVNFQNPLRNLLLALMVSNGKNIDLKDHVDKEWILERALEIALFRNSNKSTHFVFSLIQHTPGLNKDGMLILAASHNHVEVVKHLLYGISFEDNVCIQAFQIATELEHNEVAREILNGREELASTLIKFKINKVQAILATGSLKEPSNFMKTVMDPNATESDFKLIAATTYAPQQKNAVDNASKLKFASEKPVSSDPLVEIFRKYSVVSKL